MSRDVARELRRLRWYGGGRAVFILADKDPRVRLLPSTPACEAIERAAGRLGYGNHWKGVVKALERWALPDVLSEAIEEQEALP